MSRIVVLMKHADATENGLTVGGEREACDVAAEMLKTDFHPSLILTSPDPGSVETALIISHAYKAAGKFMKVRKDDGLRRKGVAATLANLQSERNVVAISQDDPIADAVRDLSDEYLKGLAAMSGQAIFVSSEQPDWASVARSHDSVIVRTLRPFVLEGQR